MSCHSNTLAEQRGRADRVPLQHRGGSDAGSKRKPPTPTARKANDSPHERAKWHRVPFCLAVVAGPACTDSPGTVRAKANGRGRADKRRATLADSQHPSHGHALACKRYKQRQIWSTGGVGWICFQAHGVPLPARRRAGIIAQQPAPRPQIQRAALSLTQHQPHIRTWTLQSSCSTGSRQRRRTGHTAPAAACLSSAACCR